MQSYRVVKTKYGSREKAALSSDSAAVEPIAVKPRIAPATMVRYGRHNTASSSSQDAGLRMGAGAPSSSLPSQEESEEEEEEDDEEEEEEETQVRLAPPLRTRTLNTHELVEAGKRSEFVDNVDFMLDGLRQECPLSIRHQSAQTLIKKLSDSSFLFDFVGSDMTRRTFRLLQDKPDTALEALTLCFAALILPSWPALEALVGEYEFLQLVSSWLDGIVSLDGQLPASVQVRGRVRIFRAKQRIGYRRRVLDATPREARRRTKCARSVFMLLCCVGRGLFYASYFSDLLLCLF